MAKHKRNITKRTPGVHKSRRGECGRSTDTPNVASPLTDEEFDRLSEFLDSDPEESTMPIEALDGFFCALIVGPDTVMPSEYLPVLFGREASNMNRFRSQRETDDILSLLARYWNTIVSELRTHRNYAPMYDAPDRNGVVGRAWAVGFLAGIHMRTAAWRELIESPGSEDLAAIALVAGELDPAWPDRKISKKEMHNLAVMMACAVARSHEYFLAKRTPERTPRSLN